MDAIARSPFPDPINTNEASEVNPCPICLVEFYGRDVMSTVVKTRCGHCFDLQCISQYFISLPVGSRRCAYCRQDPMPLVNKNTGESYPDEFFPDRAFFNACSRGNLALVSSRLLNGGGSVNGVMDNKGFTALMLAARNGQFEVVKLLIEKGAEVSAVNENGFTTLMLAAQSGQLEIVKLLVDKGAEVSAVNNNGFTARILAMHNCHSNVVEFLIDKELSFNYFPNSVHPERSRRGRAPDFDKLSPNGVRGIRRLGSYFGTTPKGAEDNNRETHLTLTRFWQMLGKLDQAEGQLMARYGTNLTLARYWQMMGKLDKAEGLLMATFRQESTEVGDLEAGRACKNNETNLGLALRKVKHLN